MPDDDRIPEPKPHLRVVPEADEATRRRLEEEVRQRQQEHRRSFAETHLRIALRDLSANVLRIVRGAGRPHRLPQDCANVLDALDTYKDAVGTWPPAHVIGDFLQFTVERRGSEDRIDYEIAVEQMIRGALQFVASTKLHQIPQMRGAEGELLDGARRYLKYQEAANAAWNARWKPTRKAKTPVKKGKRRKKPDPGF